MTIRGNCPMGCGATLFVDTNDTIQCRGVGCPRPFAASEILGEAETEHLVTVGERYWSVKHPLRERLDDELLHCELGEYLEDLDKAPAPPGVYRVSKRAGDYDPVEFAPWFFELVEVLP